MVVMKLILAPDPLLRLKSEPLAHVDDEIRQFMDSMLETMKHNDGCGLAAIQVGVPKRILLIDNSFKEEGGPKFFINPEVVEYSDELSQYSEGCLSLPNSYLEVERPKFVTVKYIDYDGKQQEEKLPLFASRAFQHELDHLNGTTLLDHASKVKADMMMMKIRKYKKSLERKTDIL